MSTIQEATEASTKVWQQDLQSLFLHAKERYPDVVWEFPESDEIWGHKAIVYARAPPSFQSRYFQSPNRSYESQLSLPDPDVSRSPSPMPSQPGQLLKLSTDINPTLFSNELEYLYTAQGFGEAFEFLFDSNEASHREEGDAEELRIDKLRKDLVFMWRSRLYSDVRISLSGTFSSVNHEEATAIFSSHRFILVSRSDYFHTALLGWPSPSPPKPLSASISSDSSEREREVPTLTLPSPPFTPASLHFTLGYIYTGTLVFSHRSYDLDTAFAILRSSLYLNMPALQMEVQARIVQEMLHGLFHAPLDFAAYEQITGGKWGTGGCKCRQCARRAPRVLEFALADDVKNMILDRGARRALVGLFGEGWCTREFSDLPAKIKDNLLKGVAKRTTPLNVFQLLFTAEKALQKLGRLTDVWADDVRDYIHGGRKGVDECLCNLSDQCFGSFGESGESEGQETWAEIMQSDGVRFDDPEKIDWIMAAVIRGLSDKNAAVVYQTLVSSILLRPHPTEPSQAMLNSASPIRTKVEQTRLHIMQYLRKRWINVRSEGGFDDVEGWAVKEISDCIEVSYEDLLAPVQHTRHSTRGVPRNKHDGESDAASSMRVSILSRNLPKSSAASMRDDRSIRSGISLRNGADNRSIRSGISSTTLGRRSVTPTGKERPDSKLTPPTPQRPVPPTPEVVVPEEHEGDDDDVEGVEVKSTPPPNNPPALIARPSSSASVRSSAASVRSSAASVRSTARKPSVPSNTTRKSVASTIDRPKSRASSIKSSAASIKSNATIRKTSSGSSSLKPPSGKTSARRPSASSSTASRPSSSLSTASSTTGSTVFKTATTRSRTTSTGSVGSTRSTNTTTTSRSTTTSKTPTTPTAKRPPSIASSIRSTVSTTSTRSPRITVRKTSGAPSTRSPSVSSVKGKEKEKTPAPPLPKNPVIVLKGKERAQARALKKKESTDTITGKLPPPPPIDTTPTPTTEDTPAPMDVDVTTLGATLSIGIPCIITSNRKRFKAFARYIGEVEGEVGPWVGVEVPADALGNGSSTMSTEWNDGTLRGVRYFTISPGEFDDLDRDASKGKRGTKRGAGALSPGTSAGREKRLRSTSPGDSAATGASRGLFVRPQQVLYVVDAIDGDL